jgi:5'-3' exonuclease
VLWSCSRVEAAAGGRTLIATADRDLYQAVAEHTAVLELRRDGPPGTIDATACSSAAASAPIRSPI